MALPHRRYHLFRAPLAAHEAWIEDQRFGQSANLVWPDDHGWCLATEIDFGFTLLGCGRAVADAVLADPALEAFEIGVDDNMSWSGDTINPAPAGLTCFVDPPRSTGPIQHGAPAEPLHDA